jgi:hypothetical protein
VKLIHTLGVYGMDELTNTELATRLRDNAEWCEANEWEIPICMGDDQREAADRLEAMAKRLDELGARSESTRS